jgi:hypothetical protein
MPSINCPKCGFSQEKGAECRRCGVIFERFYNASAYPRLTQYAPLPEPAAPPATGFRSQFRRCYRVSRAVALTGLLLVAGLALRASTPPEIITSANTTRRAQAKVERFQLAAHEGRADELALNQAELNGWLGENLALNQPAPSPALPPSKPLDAAIGLARLATAPAPAESAAAAQDAPSIRDLKIELLEDSLRIYASFDFHGVELSLELEGQPVVQNGYLRLVVRNGRLGSLPLPIATLRKATDRIFDAPDNREKFHLPPEVRDVRVEQGQIVVFPR